MKENIVGRRTEIKKLLAWEASDKSELVCLYGRRRVGKTFLVNNLFDGQFAFRITGMEKGKTRDQLKSFHRSLQHGGEEDPTPLTDWFDAFDRLDSLLTSSKAHLTANGKKLVFIDEFPWLASTRSNFLEMFAWFWNHCCAHSKDVMVIICGSATAWIIDNILNNTGSLFDRSTRDIFLEPFTVSETGDFFRSKGYEWPLEQLIECQMVFGGLPFFLDKIEAGEGLAPNIDELCLKPHATFRNEMFRLLETTLRHSDVYDQILSELSRHKYGIKQKDLVKKLSCSEPTALQSIKLLEKCGYISQYKHPSQPYHPTYVMLIDPFILFHYHFLSDGADAPKTWDACRHEEGRYKNWRGNALEVLALYHKREIKEALGISGVETKEYPWYSAKKKGGAQIDLVIERADKMTDLIELKFTDEPYDITSEYNKKLVNKKAVFKQETKTKDMVRIVVISINGFTNTRNAYNVSAFIDGEDLFG